MKLRAYVEGPTDVEVAVRVAQHAGHTLDPVDTVPVGGHGALDQGLHAYLAMATRKRPVWVLRDCDPTAPNLKGVRFTRCGGSVLRQLGVANAGDGWVFRLARHEAESWLMADVEAFARWLGVSPSRIPSEPDEILKAKLQIVEVARFSTKPDLRALLVPREGSSAEFGPAFEEALRRFVTGSWSPTRAAKRSPSLRRCLAALRRL